jgi:hypothetical protein
LLRDSELNIISLNQKSKTLEEYFINVINKDNKN